MRVLVACEYSGTVRDAFVRLGHDAWSCDILPTERMGNHIQGDCIEAISNSQWDCIIMHPPCTKIALCANGTYGKNKPRHCERLEAIEWTKSLWNLAIFVCPKVAMENPKNVMGAHIGQCTQKIHPWMFGHLEKKETWLWLHGLLPLVETNNVYDAMMQLPVKDRERIWYMSPGKNRGHERSLTYQGIADAMATQWSNPCTNTPLPSTA